MRLATPYYLIDERKLLRNLKTVDYVRRHSGAKCVLALKCFSTWCVFGLMRKYMDGTTSSSLPEARLGREKFGKEVHAYSVGWTPRRGPAGAAIRRQDHFQLDLAVRAIRERGPRAERRPAREPGSQLFPFRPGRPGAEIFAARRDGPPRPAEDRAAARRRHVPLQLRKRRFRAFFARRSTGSPATTAPLLETLEWVSLGGGLYFTKEGYPLDAFCRKLREFAERFRVQVYLEPGEAAITRSAELVTTVLDIVHNESDHRHRGRLDRGAHARPAHLPPEREDRRDRARAGIAT